ncbi:MAG: hypothetical protein J6B29_01585 [Clostridia bacterium]|nr:hypothetical protein [Clostridia bacterium]
MSSEIIGYCTECGIAVNEDNLGTTTPKVVCNACVIAKEEQAERERVEAIESEKRKKSYNRSQLRKRLIISCCVSGALAVAMFFVALFGLKVNIGICIGLTYVTFTFASSLFIDGLVREMMGWFIGRTVAFPGLIFEFDFDGILWYFGMRILFAVLGFLAGVLFAIIGVALGIVASAVIYPFTLVRQIALIAKGEDEDFD